MPVSFPIYKMKKDAPFYPPVSKYTNLHFYNFTEAEFTAICPDTKQRIYGINMAPDYLPL